MQLIDNSIWEDRLHFVFKVRLIFLRAQLKWKTCSDLPEICHGSDNKSDALTFLII